jgi:DNA-binding PadR family transcriptional regulator
MARIIESRDQIILSRNDIRVLLALLRGRMNSYQISLQIHEDSKFQISNGALRPSLARLKAMSLIGQKDRLYRITPLGKDLLRLELDRLDHIATIGRERLASKL